MENKQRSEEAFRRRRVMTIRNWIELAIVLGTSLFYGISLTRASRKVADLDGAELLEPRQTDAEINAENIISGI